MKQSANGSAFVDGIKSLLIGLVKILSILLSWAFKFIGIVGEKLSELFSKLGNK